MEKLISSGALCVALLAPLIVKDEKKMQITTWMPGVHKIPKPSQVLSTSDWYLLNHVTGKLITFNHEANRFEPLIAKSWDIQDSLYTFKIDPEAVFHDGTKITATDVAASIKFLIKERKSTHFPVWEFIENCSDVISIESECPGIRIIDDQTIQFRLAQKTQSFFLMLASPEGGIWHPDDLKRFEEGKPPKLYSGPYFLKSIERDQIRLGKNLHSRLSKAFPSAPEELLIYGQTEDSLKESLDQSKIDVFFETARPFTQTSYGQNYRSHNSNPSTILYLYKANTKDRSISREFISALWHEASTSELQPADTFLPFFAKQGISREDFLDSLPSLPAKKRTLRIATLFPYFTQGLLDHLSARAKSVGIDIEFVKLDSPAWFKAFEDIHHSQFDFILSAYVASERYPSVQLRYLLEKHSVPVDISPLDNPDWTAKESALLKEVEKQILKSQSIIPLYFVSNKIRYREGIEIGNQPVMDSEIQLWRVGKAQNDSLAK